MSSGRDCFELVALILFGLAGLDPGRGASPGGSAKAGRNANTPRAISLPHRTVLGSRSPRAAQRSQQRDTQRRLDTGRGRTRARGGARGGELRSRAVRSSQRIASGDAGVGGELAVVSGWPLRQRVAVSSSTTADASNTRGRSGGN